MRIIIAGCTDIGLQLAKSLAQENHDIIIIDSDASLLSEISSQVDVLTVCGNETTFVALNKAKVKEADLLIATQSDDERNLLTCASAHFLNASIHTIVRIGNPDFSLQAYEMKPSLGLSMIFNPEKQCARDIARLLRYPGFLKHDTFADNRAEIVELKVAADSILCNHALVELNHLVASNVIVVAVLREGKAVIPSGDFVLLENDRIFVTAATEGLSELLNRLGMVSKRVKKVLILGGETVSAYLVEFLLSAHMDVVVAERDAKLCEALASRFPKATVINSEEREDLETEGFNNMGAVVALTPSDEKNILYSLYAKGVNIPQIVTRLNDYENVAIVNELSLGAVINPAVQSINSIIRYVRAMAAGVGDVLSVHTIADGMVEALEFAVLDKKYCGISLRHLNFRRDCRVACILHGNEVVIPNGDACLCYGDTVVMVTPAGHRATGIADLIEG